MMKLHVGHIQPAPPRALEVFGMLLRSGTLEGRTGRSAPPGESVGPTLHFGVLDTRGGPGQWHPVTLGHS
eukprot:4955622-Pyramimonas_sp.AAC.2